MEKLHWQVKGPSNIEGKARAYLVLGNELKNENQSFVVETDARNLATSATLYQNEKP